MRGVRSLLVASVLVVGFAAGAAAQTGPRFDIQIERDTRPRTSILTNLSAAYRVTLRDHDTGQAPTASYVMFSQATNAQGEKSPFFACGHVNDVDSRTPPGVYDCIVYVDHGGPWTFVASVSKERSDARQAPVALAQASVGFELPVGEVARGEDVKTANLKAKPKDVALLLGPPGVAVAWVPRGPARPPGPRAITPPPIGPPAIGPPAIGPPWPSRSRRRSRRRPRPCRSWSAGHPGQCTSPRSPSSPAGRACGCA